MQALLESAIRATLIAGATALLLRVARITAPRALHAFWSRQWGHAFLEFISAEFGRERASVACCLPCVRNRGSKPPRNRHSRCRLRS